MIDEARQAKESIKNIPDPLTVVEVPEDDYEYMYQVGQEPMTLDEAKQQLELLGHDFYVFTNSDNGKTNTVYKKQDGRYGVIVEK
jgi:putative sigma-54 modulation protein